MTRAKLVEEAEAAGQRVIDAARAWEATDDAYARAEATRHLRSAVRDLNAKLAKAERAR